MIFQPDWVASRLFNKTEIECLVPIASPAPNIFRHDTVTLQVSERRVVLNARQPTDGALQELERLAITLLRELPHTPVSAVGINFAFVEERPADSVLDLFNFGDDASIAAHDWDIETRKLTRALRSEGQLLNLTLSLQGTTLQIEANFHTAVSSTEEASMAIEQKVRHHYEQLETLLSDVYQLAVPGVYV